MLFHKDIYEENSMALSLLDQFFNKLFLFSFETFNYN